MYANWSELKSFIYIIYIYIYIYIYISTNLLPNSINSIWQRKRKKKPELRDKKYLESLPGKKRKRSSGEKKKKKEKANHVTPIEKKSRDTQSFSQKNKNPPQNY